MIEAAGRQEPLCELELELISGQTESLFTLAAELLNRRFALEWHLQGATGLSAGGVDA